MLRTRLLVPATALALFLATSSLPSGEKQGKDKDAKGGDDTTFVMKASASDMAEIALGKLAQKKAGSDEVKSFAKHMVDDHTKSSEELKMIAKRKGFALAKELDGHHKEMMEKLSKMSGADFDKAYMSGQVKAHEEAIKLFRKQAKSGEDGDLRAFANKTLPVIEGHYKQAKQIAGK